VEKLAPKWLRYRGCVDKRLNRGRVRCRMLHHGCVLNPDMMAGGKRMKLPNALPILPSERLAFQGEPQKTLNLRPRFNITISAITAGGEFAPR
jgi:hypothetical protein